MRGRPVNTELSIWKRVAIGHPDSCWEWLGCRYRHGYGRVRWAGKNSLAHRVTYEIQQGPIAPGLELDHLCRNRGCVNPYHLEPVTCRENVLRGMGLAANNARKTHCLNGHEFTRENTYRLPDGRRNCKECSRKRTRLRRENQP